MARTKAVLTAAERKRLLKTDITRHPDFTESLRLLIEEEKYTMTDVGFMFGRSRERVRQWCVRAGITRGKSGSGGLYAVRVWNDATHRFQPVSLGRVTQTARAQRSAQRKTARDVKYATRREVLPDAVASLVLQLGRSPSYSEIAALVVPNWERYPGRVDGFACMVSYCYGKNTANEQELLRVFLRACGHVARPRGGAGHVR